MSDDIAAANKRLVRRFYKEVYGDWNMTLVPEVVSPRFISHDWPEGGPTGPQGFELFYSAIRAALPDARYEVDDLIAEGDKVVVRWRLLGTHLVIPPGAALSGPALPVVVAGHLFGWLRVEWVHLRQSHSLVRLHVVGNADPRRCDADHSQIFP